MAEFHEVLEILGRRLDLQLKPDRHNACRLDFPDGVKLQLEVDRSGESYVVVSEVGEIPPGAFRERLFRA